MKRIVVVLMLVLPVLGIDARAEEDSGQTGEELARQLLEVSGSARMGLQVMEQLINQFKQMQPNIPEEFWDELMAEVDAEDLKELVVPIYTKHLTEEEMRAALDFYTTPVGKSILEKMPLIMQESMLVGQRWGMELGQSIGERIERWRADHPDA